MHKNSTHILVMLSAVVLLIASGCSKPTPQNYTTAKKQLQCAMVSLNTLIDKTERDYKSNQLAESRKKDVKRVINLLGTALRYARGVFRRAGLRSPKRTVNRILDDLENDFEPGISKAYESHLYHSDVNTKTEYFNKIKKFAEKFRENNRDRYANVIRIVNGYSENPSDYQKHD